MLKLANLSATETFGPSIRGIEAKKHRFKTIDFEPEIEENNIIVIQSLELNRLERGEAARSRGKI